MTKHENISRFQPKHQKNIPSMILVGISITYLAFIIYIPAFNIFFQAFNQGLEPFFTNICQSHFLHAVGMTLKLALIAVPLNTIFGLCAACSIARNTFTGRSLLLSIIDLPFSISPIVVGLMMVLVYGKQGWFGDWLHNHDLSIIFAFPGMVIVTAFVSMPFIAREVIPVLEEIGNDQEQAAGTLGANNWQIFWRITLPNIRWGLLYGLILTSARALGEFGAVAVVSGNIIGKTQTVTLYIEDAYKNYDAEAAYSAAVLLALLAIITLVLKQILESKVHTKNT